MNTLPLETFASDAETAPLTAEGLLRLPAHQRPGVTALTAQSFEFWFGSAARLHLSRGRRGGRSIGRVVRRARPGAGDTIAVQLPNLALTPLALLGAWRAGLSVAMLPMLWREHEIGMALRGGRTEGTDRHFALRRRQLRRGFAELLLRGPVVPRTGVGPLAPDRDGFVATGLRAAPGSDDHTILRIKCDAELRRQGGIALALSELDELYRGFPGCLDAACFVLPDPVMGDRVFAAVMPRPGEAASLEELNRFLTERGVAPYKFPDKLLLMREIPRDADGRVLRDEILRQV